VTLLPAPACAASRYSIRRRQKGTSRPFSASCCRLVLVSSENMHQREQSAVLRYSVMKSMYARHGSVLSVWGNFDGRASCTLRWQVSVHPDDRVVKVVKVENAEMRHDSQCATQDRWAIFPSEAARRNCAERSSMGGANAWWNAALRLRRSRDSQRRLFPPPASGSVRWLNDEGVKSIHPSRPIAPIPRGCLPPSDRRLGRERCTGRLCSGKCLV